MRFHRSRHLRGEDTHVGGLEQSGQLDGPTRLQHIVVLAKTLRGRLEFGTLVIAPAQPPGRTPETPA